MKRDGRTVTFDIKAAAFRHSGASRSGNQDQCGKPRPLSAKWMPLGLLCVHGNLLFSDWTSPRNRRVLVSQQKVFE
jgi:hypothetical protein